MSKRSFAQRQDIAPVEMRPGHTRQTLTYNDELMLSHFEMKAGVTMPLHQHEASQIGYVLSGKVKFFNDKGDLFTAGEGGSYVFGSNEPHGCTVLEDCTLIEVFSPMREDYAN